MATEVRCSGLRFSCLEALDDTESEPIGLLDAEAEVADTGERPAPEMLAGQRDRDPFVEPLDRAQRERAGDHVINEQEAAAGSQHPGHFRDRTTLVGNG